MSVAQATVTQKVSQLPFIPKYGAMLESSFVSFSRAQRDARITKQTGFASHIYGREVIRFVLSLLRFHALYALALGYNHTRPFPGADRLNLIIVRIRTVLLCTLERFGR